MIQLHSDSHTHLLLTLLSVVGELPCMRGVNVDKYTTPQFSKLKTVAPLKDDMSDYVVAEPPKNAVESFFA